MKLSYTYGKYTFEMTILRILDLVELCCELDITVNVNRNLWNRVILILFFFFFINGIWEINFCTELNELHEFLYNSK